jgi:hypothetical protein
VSDKRLHFCPIACIILAESLRRCPVPRKRFDRLDDWISGYEAARIMTERSGHAIHPDYVRRLGNAGKLTTKKFSERAKLYLKSDVERYVVDTKRGRKPKHVKEAA